MIIRHRPLSGLPTPGRLADCPHPAAPPVAGGCRQSTRGPLAIEELSDGIPGPMSVESVPPGHKDPRLPLPRVTPEGVAVARSPVDLVPVCRRQGPDPCPCAPIPQSSRNTVRSGSYLTSTYVSCPRPALPMPLPSSRKGTVESATFLANAARTAPRRPGAAALPSSYCRDAQHAERLAAAAQRASSKQLQVG